MLQIIPINKRTEKHVDTDNIKYIENSDILNSMPKKYNYAIDNYILNSTEDIICFRHEDTELRTPIDICEYRCKKLLESYNIGVIGLIGTIALEPSCAWWTGVSNAGGRETYGAGAIIQGGTRIAKDNNNNIKLNNDGKPIYEEFEYPMNDHPGIHTYMATVDGCCMFFPRKFFESGIRFDENLQGYHFYDSDICLQALAHNYKVSTIDITVKHSSQGALPKNWENLKKNFFNKWNNIVDQWPISRLTKFNLNNIKKIKKANNDKESEIQENKPTV